MIDLSSCSFFAGLQNPRIIELFSSVHHQIKQYEVDEIIAYSGDDCNSLLIVMTGEVVAEMLNFDGRSIKIEAIAAPNTLAEAFVFGNQNLFPVTIIAKTKTSILSIPRDELVKLFQMESAILQNYLDAISNRTQFLSSKMRFLAFKTIKAKLSSYLLKLAGTKLKTISMPMTQENLAGFFGVARPSLARALAELQLEGAISINRKEITIIDRSVLLGYLE
jgi:CRP-like cAMP-binding protein